MQGMNKGCHASLKLSNRKKYWINYVNITSGPLFHFYFNGASIFYSIPFKFLTYISMNNSSPIPEFKNFLKNEIKSQQFFLQINSKKIFQQKRWFMSLEISTQNTWNA